MARLQRRHLLGSALALALPGCVVAPRGTYWRPATTHPGARFTRADCQGQAGPVTQVAVDLAAGVVLTARAGREGAGPPPGVPLGLDITVPGGGDLQLAGPIRFVADGRGTDAFGTVWVTRTEAVPPEGWIDPPVLRPGYGPAAARDARAPFGVATFRFLRTGPAPRRVEVPAMELEWEGGRRQPIAPAVLDQTGTGYGYRGTGSERGETPDLAWQWRWQRVVIAQERLEGELELRVRREGRWRLRAADGLPPRSATLVFADRIGMNRVSGSSAPMRLRVEATFPAATAEFEARLPALVVGGQRIEPPQVRFERRGFEVGVEPFNC